MIVISARYADDAGHKKFTEEVYQHQDRLLAGAQWQPKKTAWTDLVKNILRYRFIFLFIQCILVVNRLATKF